MQDTSFTHQWSRSASDTLKCWWDTEVQTLSHFINSHPYYHYTALPKDQPSGMIQKLKQYSLVSALPGQSKSLLTFLLLMLEVKEKKESRALNLAALFLLVLVRWRRENPYFWCLKSVSELGNKGCMWATLDNKNKKTLISRKVLGRSLYFK